MIILISCAKTMSAKGIPTIPFTTTPLFQEDASRHALEISQSSTSDLEKMLGINTKLAIENHIRYNNFFSEDNISIPSIVAYSGTVFKHINVNDFTADDFAYAQKHLRITSFLYGLLRPLDAIKRYRLEGNVKLICNDDQSMFDFWKERLTDMFIEEIKNDGGVLINLASNEMKELFDWSRVMREVKIITPEFQIMKKGKLKTIVVYAKMCRGEMVRYIIKNRIESPMLLQDFNWEGFTFNIQESSENKHLFNLFS